MMLNEVAAAVVPAVFSVVAALVAVIAADIVFSLVVFVVIFVVVVVAAVGVGQSNLQMMISGIKSAKLRALRTLAPTRLTHH